jgi:hypothetical protein
MALAANQSVCIRCGQVRLTDTTGLYNEETNPGGYGAPNPAFGEADPYTAEFIPPGATEPVFTLDLNLNPPPFDDNGHLVYVMEPDQFGYTDNLKSGVWTLRVTMGTSVRTKKFLAVGEIEERIRKCICCGGVKHIDLDVKLRGAWRLFRCYKYDEAQDVIDQLYHDTASCCDCGCSDA